jgi:hypothetical protein
MALCAATPHKHVVLSGRHRLSFWWQLAIKNFELHWLVHHFIDVIEVVVANSLIPTRTALEVRHLYRFGFGNGLIKIELRFAVFLDNRLDPVCPNATMTDPEYIRRLHEEAATVVAKYVHKVSRVWRYVS